MDYHPYYRRARRYRRGGVLYGDKWEYIAYASGSGLMDDLKEKLRVAKDVAADYAHRGKVGLQHVTGDILTEGSQFVRDPRRYIYEKQQFLGDIMENEGRRLRSASGYYGGRIKPYYRKTTYYGKALDPYDYVGYKWE